MLQLKILSYKNNSSQFSAIWRPFIETFTENQESLSPKREKRKIADRSIGTHDLYMQITQGLFFRHLLFTCTQKKFFTFTCPKKTQSLSIIQNCDQVMHKDQLTWRFDHYNFVGWQELDLYKNKLARKAEVFFLQNQYNTKQTRYLRCFLRRGLTQQSTLLGRKPSLLFGEKNKQTTRLTLLLGDN